MGGKVLILTYYWPPAGGPGVQRFLKFARYLGEFGWEPVIITPREGSYPYRDDTLLADVPPGLKVVHTSTREPFALYNRLTGKKGKEVPVAMTGFKESRNPIQHLAKWVRANFFIPDARVGWKPYAIRAALQEIARGDVKAIISTGPPHSTHLAGMALRKESGLPWIADFRDPWTTVYYNAFFPRSRRTERVDQRLEDQVLQQADQVLVISSGMADEFRDRARAIEVLYNGFDEADLYTGADEASERFYLAYIGNMKPNQQVAALWRAAAACSNKSPEFKRDFCLQFTGSMDPTIAQAIAEAGLADQLEILPFVPHQQATRLMSQSSMLLLIIPDAKDNERIITGKIFEYLASQTRVLSIGPVQGDAAAILRQAGRSAMLDYGDQTSMEEALLQAHSDWLRGGRMPLRERGGDYLRYSRRGLSEQLAEILNRLCQGPTARGT